MATSVSLVAQLRRRIKDDRVGRTAFRLACNDSNASECLLSLTESGRLTTTVINGRDAKALNVDLTDFRYDTIRKLVEYLKLQDGYECIPEQDYNPDHPSIDIKVMGSMDIQNEACPFAHHLFSDSELYEILKKACQRHNISYLPETTPENEYEFVLMLATAMVQRELARDAAKRKGLETSVTELLAAADAEERAYSGDVRRQQRVIPTPKFQEDDTGTGDVVVGSVYRRSGRNGYNAPLASAMGPTVPVLEEPGTEDVEDVKVTLRWKRNHDLNFHGFELWRDTVPNVRRPPDRQLVTDPPQLLRLSTKLPYTAKLVYRAHGPNLARDRVGFSTFSESSGQLVCQFVDTGLSQDRWPTDGAGAAPSLEPETTYYYRLFVQSLNGEWTASNTVAATTLAMRALMKSPKPLSPDYGPSGTLVTVLGSGFTGLTSGSPPGGVTLGGKPVQSLIIVSDSVLTFVVPVFKNPNASVGRMDLVLVSPNTGLIDVYANAFQYRST